MKNSGLAYWMPRTILMIFIFLLSLLSVDAFLATAGFVEALSEFLMHNIPAVILLIITLISWRYELFGAIFFLLAGIIYFYLSLLTEEWGLASGLGMNMSLLAFILGGLFIFSWIKNKN